MSWLSNDSIVYEKERSHWNWKKSQHFTLFLFYNITEYCSFQFYFRQPILQITIYDDARNERSIFSPCAKYFSWQLCVFLDSPPGPTLRWSSQSSFSFCFRSGNHLNFMKSLKFFNFSIAHEYDLTI